MRASMQTVALVGTGIAFLCVLAVIAFFATEKPSNTRLPSVASINDAYSACIGLQGDEEIATCLTRLASDAYDQFSVSKITEVLDSLPLPAKNKWCHEMMHYMGWKAYQTEQDIAESFLNASELCDSGMYHGIMEEYLREQGLQEDIADIVKNICTTSLSSHPAFSAGTLGLCHHGLGHGLMYITASDLKRSLELCDSLEGIGDALNCYSGAFMEHSTSKEIGPLANSRDLKDFSYCEELNGRHKNTCYYRQGQDNFSATGGEVKGAMELCLKVPTEYVTICFEGVGANNPSPGKSHADAAKACAGALEISGEAYTACIKGSLSFVFGLERGDVQGAIDFCAEISETFKMYCYFSAGHAVVPWLTETHTKEMVCNAFETREAIEQCLKGIN